MPSQLAPPTLHWSQVGPTGDKCDLCGATLQPLAECFLCIRRAFEFHNGQMLEVPPLRVLMCVDCGWTRPYAPTPREGSPRHPDAEKTPQTGNTDIGGAFPRYHDSGVMDDA